MDRATTEEHLAEAERTITVGRGHIERQREIVARLRDTGNDAALARQLLQIFESLQTQHEVHRDRLWSELHRQDD